MNELSEVFAKQKIQEDNNQNQNDIDLPTYSQINFNKNNNNIVKKKKDSDNEGLANYIGNLNKKNPNESVAECAPIPLNQVNIKQSSYKRENSGPINEEKNNFEFSENNKNNDNENIGSQIQLNIYSGNDRDKNKKKCYVNNSSFKNPNEDYDDDENPYKDF